MSHCRGRWGHTVRCWRRALRQWAEWDTLAGPRDRQTQEWESGIRGHPDTSRQGSQVSSSRHPNFRDIPNNHNLHLPSQVRRFPWSLGVAKTDTNPSGQSLAIAVENIPKVSGSRSPSRSSRDGQSGSIEDCCSQQQRFGLGEMSSSVHRIGVGLHELPNRLESKRGLDPMEAKSEGG